MKLDELPNDVIVQMFKIMNVKEAMRLSSTSRRYYSILNNSDYGLWKYYLNRDFPHAAWPIDDSQYKAAYIRAKIAKISDVIDFILTHNSDKFHNTEPLAVLKIRISCLTYDTPINELSSLCRDASDAIIAPSLINICSSSPLSMAVYSKRIDIALTLLEAGCSVIKHHKEPTTSLVYAAKHGFTNVVLSMIKSGADVNVRDIIRCQPLTIYPSHLKMRFSFASLRGFSRSNPAPESYQ
jgi:hypothetical protein